MFFDQKATEGVNNVIKLSKEFANKKGTNIVSTEHLLYGLVCNEGSVACNILKEFNVNSTIIDKSVANQITSESMRKLELSASVISAFETSGEISKKLGNSFVGTEHLLFALLLNNNCVAALLLTKRLRVSLQKIKERTLQVLKAGGKLTNNATKTVVKQVQSGGDLNKELLNSGTDLTLKAKNGKIDAVIGREEEINRIIEILCRKSKNNPVLIGEPGVGKSAVVEGLALKIAKAQVPSILRNKIIYSLDTASIVAGTKFRGALEEKLKGIINSVIANPNIVLFIDELHTLAQMGGDNGEISPFDILKPYLARGEVQTIGATTTKEYAKFIEVDKATDRRFQKVVINPPTKEETVEILNGIKSSYESFHNVFITQDAIEAAVELSDKYITDRNLPDKAIDLIDEASSKTKLNKTVEIKADPLKEKEAELVLAEESKKQAMQEGEFTLASRIRSEIKIIKEELNLLRQNYVSPSTDILKITAEDIAEVVASWTGVPVSKITDSEKKRLMNMENILKQRVIGQDNAVSSVCKAIRRSRVGLQDSSKPIGSFLFMGQTGVGKTELTKAIAESMFDNENLMIRLDMSEYMESHSVAKLIGSPAGYVGHDDGGILTEAVKRKPYSVVLFDEIEKAHPDVFNLLLQVLDDGRLTDSRGNTVNFKNTIIILTSNVGANRVIEFKKNSVLSDFEMQTKIKNIYTEQLKKKFRPELLNRMTDIIVFNSLSQIDLAKIAKIMIVGLSKKLKNRDLKVKFTDNAFKHLIIKGTNLEYGARPLARIIEKEIENKIAEDLLNDSLKANKTIIIDEENGSLKFEYVNNR